MTEIQTLLIIMLIIYILNYITITPQSNTIINNKDSFNDVNKKESYKLDKKAKIIKYGQIQYDVINYDDDTSYKYQNIDILKKNKTFELSDNINKVTYNFKKNTVTNLPCQQDIIYDTKFYQPSDIDIYKPTDLTKINYKERKIQNIYDEIVNGPKINTKKQIPNSFEFDVGASGLKTYKNIDWMYEGDDDGLSYDPMASNISTF